MKGETGGQRRRDLHRLLAFGVLLTALLALWRSTGPEPGPLAPPRLTTEAAAYRPDGGQMIRPSAGLKPNALSRLNFGRRLVLTRTPPRHLAALPGLGEKSAVRARERGCLNARERRNIQGLVIEECDLNKH